VLVVWKIPDDDAGGVRMSGTDGKDDSQDQQDGQVSEMVADGPEEISSGDSVAGQPDPHPGEVDEGAQGPDAVPDDPTGQHPHKP
jgi:hypothetical protein